MNFDRIVSLLQVASSALIAVGVGALVLVETGVIPSHRAASAVVNNAGGYPVFPDSINVSINEMPDISINDLPNVRVSAGIAPFNISCDSGCYSKY